MTAAFLSAAATSLVPPTSARLAAVVAVDHPVAVQALLLVGLGEAHGSVDDQVRSLVALGLGVIVVGSRCGCRGSVAADLGVNLEDSAIGLCKKSMSTWSSTYSWACLFPLQG